MPAQLRKIDSSFRDPANQVFVQGNDIYRHIRAAGVPHYRALMDSGLYARLVKEELLVPHDDVTGEVAREMGIAPGDVVIRPRKVPFISYPSEWCFSALKEAALNTLRIQKICLDHGMTLQDATAFNMQFLDGRWVLIDTGSFRLLQDGPWKAYRQFCQCFLAPLLLMSYRDVRLVSLLSRYPDGIPLDLASRLLPLRAKARMAVLMHIVLHARFSSRDFDTATARKSEARFGKAALYGLVDQLSSLVSSLDIRSEKTAWTDYEQTHTYDAREFKDKEDFILAAAGSGPATVWDLGANTGHFGRLLAKEGRHVTAFEYDFMTAEAGYRKSRAAGKGGPLHLWMDLLNPTAGLGWQGGEWPGLVQRGPADLVLALALVHHLCLAGNITIPMLADFLSRIARRLVIEFVPKEDPQSQRLLKTKTDIFPDYTQQRFEEGLAPYFEVLDARTVSGTGRRLYLLRRKD